MSTILKALRRLEEDKPDKTKSSNVEVDAVSDAGSVDADIIATTKSDTLAPVPEAKPPTRRAPTDPRATDELRERILAEERASEVARTDRARAGSHEGDETIAASASTSLAETLTPAPDPFANRVVEPAFTPPSSATLGQTHPGMDSASSSFSSGARGLLSRSLMVAALALGIVVVFLAGFLYSGQGGTTAGDEVRVAANVNASSASAPRAASAADAAAIAAIETPAFAERPSSAVAPASPTPSRAPSTQTLVQASATSLGVEPARAAVQVASGVIPSTEVPAAPVRPMTVPRSKVAPRPEAPRQAAVPKPRPAPRAAPVPEPAQAESSRALARAAVTPTRAVREAIREPIPQASSDSVVASRPRARTFPGERARVSAAAPSKSSDSTEPVQVAAAVQKAPVEELRMAEIAPSRSEPMRSEASSAARVIPEATTRAGSLRPSEKPVAPTRIVKGSSPRSSAATSVSRSGAAPIVELVERRSLPDLTVIRTSWHPTSDRRSAKIRLEEKNELVTLREGDSVGGMVIHEISPSAVVFSAGEVQIRRRVGEAPSGR